MKQYWEISQSSDRQDLGISKDTKQDKCQRLYLGISYSQLENQRKIFKEVRGGGKITFPIEEQRQKLKSDLSSGVIQASREWSEIFKVLRDNMHLEFCTPWNYSSKVKAE